MQRGIGRLRAGGGGADPDASAWAAAVTSNGGTYSASTLTAVNTFAKSAKANGYWSKLNRINLFCGNQLAACLVPLKAGSGSATETNMNFVSGDYSESTGLTGNGSNKYLKTGLIPSASLTLNNTHLAVYNRASSVTGGNIHLGSRSTDFFEFLAPASGGDITSRQYDDVSGKSSSASGAVAPYGMMIGSRTASNSHAVYQRGSSLNSNATSGGALTTVEMYIFGANQAGAITAPTSHPLAGYSIGSGLTAGEVASYSTDMQAFQTALSRQV